MRASVAPRGAGRAWLGAVGAAVTLAAVAFVVPVLLWMLTAALPVDLSSLAPAALARPDDGGLLILVLLGVAWSAWAVMAVTIGIELISALRQVPAPRLPGLAVPQRLAAALVAALVLGSTGSAVLSTPAVGEPRDLLAAVLAVQAADSDNVLPALDGRGTAGVDGVGAGGSAELDEARSDRAPTIVTQRHDTLWLLAEQHLGAGERFTEIEVLNRGQRQPDGRALGDGGRLYPGWTLRLPADADLSAQRPGRHVVARGDTLWDIAAETLGDPARYPDIATANRGDLQADGRRLSDPDLILPGWVLEVPGSVQGSATPSASPAPAVDEPDDGAQVPSLAGLPPIDRRVDPGPAETRSTDRSVQSPLASPVGPEASPPDADRQVDSSDPIDGAADSPDPIDRAGDSSDPIDPAADSPDPIDWAADGPDPIDRAAADSSDPTDRGAASDSAGSTIRGGSAAVPQTGPLASSSAPPLPAASPAAAAEAGAAPVAIGADPAREATFPLPAGGAAAGLLAVALAGELARRRGRFQRWRRPGEYMPTASRRARRLEAALVAAAEPAGSQALTTALALLTHEGARQPGLRVRVVEAGPDEVRVRLAVADVALPPPFARLADATWSASAEELSALVGPQRIPDVPGSGRALVTIGTVGPVTVLIDLEAVGTLRVVGDDQIVASVLRAMATEVALDPRFRGTTRTVCLLDGPVGEAADVGEVIVDSDPQRVGRAVDTALRRARQMSPAASSAGLAMPSPSYGDVRETSTSASAHVLTMPDVGEQAVASGAAQGEPAWSDPFEIVIADRAIGVAVPPRSGVGLATSEPADEADATVLAVRDGDQAVLLPDGLVVTPVLITSASLSDVVELMRSTDVPEGVHTIEEAAEAQAQPRRAPDDDAVPRPHLDSRAQASTAALAARDPAATAVTISARPRTTPDALEAAGGQGSEADPHGHAVDRDAPGPEVRQAPRLLLLGDVLVENAQGRAEPARIGRLAETAAFVLLNPGTRQSELLAALWPGRHANPQSCRQMISRTRTWLGRTDEGEPYLMPFAATDGRLRLRPEVGSDWADFHELAARGLADPGDVHSLEAALGLVRGRPFGSLWKRELAWADAHVNRMISRVVDVAHELAIRHEAAGRLPEARDAIYRGMRTQAESEALDQVLARLRSG